MEREEGSNSSACCTVLANGSARVARSLDALCVIVTVSFETLVCEAWNFMYLYVDGICVVIVQE